MIIYSLWLDIFNIYSMSQQRFAHIWVIVTIFCSVPQCFSLFETLCQSSGYLHSGLILSDYLTTYHGSLASLRCHSISQPCHSKSVSEVLMLIQLFSMKALSSSMNKSVAINLWGRASVNRRTGLTLSRHKHKHTQHSSYGLHRGLLLSVERSAI